MKFQADHDYHIHSYLSPCGGEAGRDQTTAFILEESRKRGCKQICVTDHYWDSAVPDKWGGYSSLNYDVISQALPLPQAEDCKFLFGCEADMDREYQLTVPPEHYDDFDFIVIAINHMHGSHACDQSLKTVPYIAEQLVKRFDAFLDKDLPFHKVGLAHLTDSLLFHGPGDPYLDVLRSISDETWERLFKRMAEKGCGLELNLRLEELTDAKYTETVLRPYRIAKAQGCKFYIGTDAHTPEGMERAKKRIPLMIDLLELEESDKFIL